METKIKNASPLLPFSHRTKNGPHHLSVLLSSLAPYSPLSPTSPSCPQGQRCCARAPHHLQLHCSQTLTVLTPDSFQLSTQQSCFQAPCPSPFIPFYLSLMFLPLPGLFYNWLVIGQLLVFANFNFKGEKTFCSLLYTHSLEQILTWSIHLVSSCWKIFLIE